MNALLTYATWSKVAPPALGFAVSVLFRFGVRLALKAVDAEVAPPIGVSKLQWDSIVKPKKPKGYRPEVMLGDLELILFFTSIWLGAYAVVGGYLLFKVGSKWQVWQHMVRVPDKLRGVDPLEYLRARRDWGSIVLMRFLIGTLYNLLGGLTGVGAGTAYAYFLCS